MSIFAISDLHLSVSEDKPMDIFGGVWQGYMNKLKENWAEVVSDDDTVIIPGDLGWSMDLKTSAEDFLWLSKLPGKKILLKGNHDYWWTSMTKMNRFVQDNGLDDIAFLHNNSYIREGVAICGTRGWICPGDEGFKEEDRTIFKREAERLKRSIDDAFNQQKGNKTDFLVVALHYPPFDSKGRETEFSNIICNSGVKVCIYGHLHSEGTKNAVEGLHCGVLFKLVSSDYLGFKPVLIK